MPRGLAWAAAASVALHVAWWFDPPSAADGPPDAGTPVPVARPLALHLRWLPRPPDAPAPALAAAALPAPAAAEPVPVRPAPPGEVPVDLARAATLAPAPVLASPAAGAIGLAPSVPAAAAPAAAVPEVDGYVPRKALSVAPAPLADITVPWPAGFVPSGRQRAVFSVFIDEGGAVQRMVADGPTLLPGLEAAAREVFMAARFAPGQVDGRAVKSLIRVEVVFDAATPVAGATSSAPSIVSRQNL
jgi:hypothetical protein